MTAGTASVSSAVAAPVFGVLTLATILLFAFLRTDPTLTGTESYALLSAYLVFVRWVVGETAGVCDLVVGA